MAAAEWRENGPRKDLTFGAYRVHQSTSSLFQLIVENNLCLEVICCFYVDATGIQFPNHLFITEGILYIIY